MAKITAGLIGVILLAGITASAAHADQYFLPGGLCAINSVDNTGKPYTNCPTVEVKVDSPILGYEYKVVKLDGSNAIPRTSPSTFTGPWLVSWLDGEYAFEVKMTKLPAGYQNVFSGTCSATGKKDTKTK